MSEWLDGFSMAWGMFLAIPCPLRRWNEKAREKMLVCLPLVGLAVGGIWLGLYLLLRHAAIGGLYAFLMAALPWLVTGFMHLDGYMDVCDAVLSRRELATRQRILKDSHCGAFAVIGMVLLALCQWSVFLSGSADESLWGLLLIPVATRACAGLAVLKLRPMGTSQYAAMGRHGGYAAALAVLLAAAIAVPLVTDRSFAPLAAAAGYGLAVWYGFRQLDGMGGMVGPVFDLKDGWPEAPVRCCRHLEALTRAASNRGETAQQVLDRLLPLTWDAFVISREIGSGVVPLDAAERRWREVHGAVLQGLAARAEHVSRIFCGLEERLK